jgi:N-acetylgalactosamine-6-sulfatase
MAGYNAAVFLVTDNGESEAMSHRRVLSHILLGLAVILLLGATPARAADAKQPNILFILADDLGWGDLGCYGHPRIKTPNLDRLAKQGTLFTQFYVNGSVCSPSRTAFLTGHFPARHAIHGHLSTAQQNKDRGMPNWLDAKVTTLPALLKKAGYATAHIGKWHLGSGEDAPTPDCYGFTDYKTINSNSPGWDAKAQNDPHFRAKSAELFVDETISFIKASRHKPFYVNLWTLVPHAPLNPTEEQMKPYMQLGPSPLAPHKGAMQIYYASVTDLDTQIGRLLKELETLGVADNTLILFSSDNGPEDIHITNASHSGVGSAGPFRGRKRSLYEGGVRVPGIVRWPKQVPAGRVDDVSIVSGVDWLPTVCALAGVKLPKEYQGDGEDVSDILRGKERLRPKPLFWEWRFPIAGDTLNKSPMLAVRQHYWKLLFNPDRSRVELYNIRRDPSELTNLADKEKEAVEQLAEKALAWQKTLPKGPVNAAAGRNDYPWPEAKKNP